MNSHFFAALLAFLIVPAALSKLLRADKMLPLVFLQLLCGLFMHLVGIDAWLQIQGVDLVDGPLADSLRGLGWLGVALLIALTGAESAPHAADRQAWRFVPISVIGFAATCTLGTLVGWGLATLYPQLKGSKADPWTFSFAIGLALSVTALPVLVALLRQTGMAQTPLGKLAVNCALLDDLWMWLGLAIVLSSTAMERSAPLRMIALLAAYLTLMLAVMRPLLRWWLAARVRRGSDSMLVCVCVILFSATLTELIGVHAILGAFVGGAILPREAVQGWREALLHFTQTLLLPLFFILTGMRLQFDVQDPLFWQLTGIACSTAVFGKLVSVALVARGTRLPWRESFALGSLMQCKGLMELVAINILLDAGVIGTQMFSALAMMALTSTIVTVPLTRLLLHGASPDRAGSTIGWQRAGGVFEST